MGCDCFIKALGYILIAVVAKKILISLYNIFFPYFIGTPIDLKKKAGGKWAVVTGSTDGIGKAYATELGRRGFNLLLVSRNQQKLDDTKKEIESEAAEVYNHLFQRLFQGVEIRTERFDFNAPLAADYAPLEKSLKSIDVGILVNNVGLSYEYPEELQKVEGGLERLQQITTTNVLPPTLLSAIVLPQMVERHAGIIINIASAAAYNKMALWAVYSATKKYVQWFSGIIRGETAGRGVIVQTVLPMLVATKMSKVEAMFALPQELVDFLTTKHSKDIRARAIRKKEKEAEKSK